MQGIIAGATPTSSGSYYRVTVEFLLVGTAARTQGFRQASLDQECTVHLSIHLQCVQFSLMKSCISDV